MLFWKQLNELSENFGFDANFVLVFEIYPFKVIFYMSIFQGIPAPAEGLQLSFKETPATTFACEFFDIFKNTCFVENLLFDMQLFTWTKVLSKPWEAISCRALHMCWTVYPNSNIWDGIITRKTSERFKTCPWGKEQKVQLLTRVLLCFICDIKEQLKHIINVSPPCLFR